MFSCWPQSSSQKHRQSTKILRYCKYKDSMKYCSHKKIITLKSLQKISFNRPQSKYSQWKSILILSKKNSKTIKRSYRSAKILQLRHTKKLLSYKDKSMILQSKIVRKLPLFKRWQLRMRFSKVLFCSIHSNFKIIKLKCRHSNTHNQMPKPFP